MQQLFYNILQFFRKLSHLSHVSNDFYPYFNKNKDLKTVVVQQVNLISGPLFEFLENNAYNEFIQSKRGDFIENR